MARERLGFEAEVGLEEGLRRLVEWWRAQRASAPAALSVAS
jgi:UDP-glucose 4-epimerase